MGNKADARKQKKGRIIAHNYNALFALSQRLKAVESPEGGKSHQKMMQNTFEYHMQLSYLKMAQF